jgi:micrococcal nuclease
MTTSRKWTLALLGAFLSGCSNTYPGAGDTIHARARAIDGDTVSIDFRLFGADAFERKQSCERGGECYRCGKLAQDFAAHVLDEGDAAITRTGSASYGRPVAIVTVNGTDMGERLIRAGLAVPRPGFLQNDPDRLRRYQGAYEAARAGHDGVHAGHWIDPADWRKGQRLACEKSATLGSSHSGERRQ